MQKVADLLDSFWFRDSFRRADLDRAFLPACLLRLQSAVHHLAILPANRRRLSDLRESAETLPTAAKIHNQEYVRWQMIVSI